MDDRLQKGLDHANYRATIYQQRQNLLARLTTTLLHAHNGGVFTVSPTLIAFVDTLVRVAAGEIVLIDDKRMPVVVSDPAAFLADILAVYHAATNEYRAEFDSLRQSRSVRAAVGL